MIGTAEYRLAKYLDSFIKPNINTEWSVNSTANFMDKIGEFNISEGVELVGSVRRDNKSYFWMGVLCGLKVGSSFS